MYKLFILILYIYIDSSPIKAFTRTRLGSDIVGESKLITKTFNSAFNKGHAAPFLNLKDSLRKFDKEKTNTKSVNRANFIQIQTPQIFRGNIIKEAYKKEKSNKTDDISLIESNVKRVNLIKGEQTNLKITTKEDWFLANLLIKN